MSAAIKRELATVVIAVLLSIAIGSVLMLITGNSPGHVWWLMVTRTLGSEYNVGDMVYRATALALTGLSVSVALDAGLFNIGVEGELTAGVLACRFPRARSLPRRPAGSSAGSSACCASRATRTRSSRRS